MPTPQAMNESYACLAAMSTVLTLLWALTVFNMVGLYSERIRYSTPAHGYFDTIRPNEVDVGIWKMYNRTTEKVYAVQCHDATECSTVCVSTQLFSVVALVGAIATTVLLAHAARLKPLKSACITVISLTGLAMFTTVALEMSLGVAHCAGSVNASAKVATVSVLNGTYITTCVVWLWLLLALAMCITSASTSATIAQSEKKDTSSSESLP